MSLATTGFELIAKRTRKREFLDEMNLVMPCSELLRLIPPHAPAGRTGRPPFVITEGMLRIHLLQNFLIAPTRRRKGVCTTALVPRIR